MTSREVVAAAAIAVPACTTLLLTVVPARLVPGLARVAAVPTAALAIVLTLLALEAPGDPVTGDWLAVDVAGGLLVAVIGIVGLASVLVSPAYLAGGDGSLVSAGRRNRAYYAALFAFWAILLAVPVAGNLGIAWLLVEATTAASALLVGFSGKPRALEAGWKYLVLTSLGLGVALLGIVILAAGIPSGGLSELSWQALPTYAGGSAAALVAYLLLIAGLAAKVGWAPVHNWLPDAHSEAPPPVSALLSAALLPAVLLIAWRSEQALAPVVGEATARGVLLGFGLASLAVAVPFLWRSLPWKRLLAYSSLEHMGVIALGIGFGTPLALAGVAIHIAGHAVSKALGFYAATPLVSHDPLAAEHAVTGIGRSKPQLGATMGISLAALAGLPPSPLFVSEVLIVAGGFQAGRPWEASATALLLALGFLGLAHALIETTAGDSPPRARGRVAGLRGLAVLTGVSIVLLLGLTLAAVVLPGSDLVDALARGALVTSYRDGIAEALAGGWRFAGLHATADGAHIRTLLAGADGSTRLETVAADEGTAPSIVDLVPAAGWDEREAHDLQGVRFAGHEPLRPLVDHTPTRERWVPLRGDDAFEVAVGPIHAGVIESGHFRFHLVGDRILHLDAQLFYKHRGLERAAEGKTLAEGLAYASRACAACAVTNGVAYAQACEEALGLVPPAELARARTILLELERMWSHLNDIAAVCAGVGLAAGNTSFAALTERARRLNAALTGHRFLFGCVQVGGSSLTLGADDVRTAREEIAALQAASSRSWRELLFNASFQDRLPDIGVVGTAESERLGAVGPAARAAGLAEDARVGSERLSYDGFEPVVPKRAAGDVQARLEQRALELLQTFALLEGLLDRPVSPANAEPGAEERPIGVGRVESPRGATSCIVERSNDRIERLRLRTGSYANWPVVARAAADNLLPDFPLINKSFELCYACVDR